MAEGHAFTVGPRESEAKFVYRKSHSTIKDFIQNNPRRGCQKPVSTDETETTPESPDTNEQPETLPNGERTLEGPVTPIIPDNPQTDEPKPDNKPGTNELRSRFSINFDAFMKQFDDQGNPL